MTEDVRENLGWDEGAGRTKGSGRRNRRSGKKWAVSERE